MINLRKATPADEPLIMNLVKTVLEEYGLKTNPSGIDKDLSDLDHNYFSRNGWFAVLEDGNRIIGTYGIYKIDQNTCELRKMYLFKEYQGKGQGRKMMDDALAKGKELGYSVMTLETNRLLSKAISLYEKYGFVKYEPDHLSDRCDLAMKRQISR